MLFVNRGCSIGCTNTYTHCTARKHRVFVLRIYLRMCTYVCDRLCVYKTWRTWSNIGHQSQLHTPPLPPFKLLGNCCQYHPLKGVSIHIRMYCSYWSPNVQSSTAASFTRWSGMSETWVAHRPVHFLLESFFSPSLLPSLALLYAVEPSSNPDTNGTEESVHISEVSLLQRVELHTRDILEGKRCPY